MLKLFPTLIFILFFYNGCQQPVSNVKNAENKTAHPGYDLTKPEVIKMPNVLNEISGIAFNNGRPDTVYAEQDEEGRLFYFPVANLDVKHKKFGKKGDYEDIAICKGTVIMLRSDGVLFSFPLNVNEDAEISNVQESAGLLPEGEYEAMSADEATGQLYVLCKNCSLDKDTKSISGYILQLTPGKGIELKSNFQVNTKDIAAKLNEKKIPFKPSALARNAKSNQWYILSSVNKLLVTTDDKWAIGEVFALDPAIFNQPEGIAFDINNNLYISNERGETGNATVLKFIFTEDKK